MHKRLAVSAVVLVAAFLAMTFSGISVASAQVVVPGSAWLSGAGVPVCNPVGQACRGVTIAPGEAPNNWQCVELAARLYDTKGWVSRHLLVPYAGAMNASWAASYGLQFHNNSSGYVPVPGDLIVLAGNPGHVSVAAQPVSQSTGVIHTVEENYSSTGRADYSLSGSTISRPNDGRAVLGIIHAPANPSTNGNTTHGTTLAADVSGGGKADLIAVNDTSAWVMLSTGSSFSAPTDWHEGTFYGSRATLACDVTGDGRTDLVAVNDNSVWVMLSTGSGFSSPQLWSSGTFYGSRATLCADVNGDHKADLIAVNDTSAWVMTSTGSSFSAPADWHEGTFYGSRTTLAASVSGGGRADLIAVNDTSAWVMTSTGSSFSAPADWHEGTFYGSRATLACDVTGDGRTDLVAVNDNSVWVMLSTGSGFSSPELWSSGTFYGSRATLCADVNGGGKADLIAVNDTSAWVMLSTGSSFSAPADWHEGTFYGS
jgi:hypothetical protein